MGSPESPLAQSAEQTGEKWSDTAPVKLVDHSVEELIVRLEMNLKQGLPLQLDPDELSAAAKILFEAGEAPSTLKRFGYRLWQVVSAASSYMPQTLLEGGACAAARELACELIEHGLAIRGCMHSKGEADLILQWAMTGKIWLDLQECAGALRCLLRSAAVWQNCRMEESEIGRMTEAAIQTYVWMSSAEMGLKRYEESFLAITKAVNIMDSAAIRSSASQGIIVRACKEHADALEQVAAHRQAADVLQLACRTVPQDDNTKNSLERASLHRHLTAVLTKLADKEAAIAAGRNAVLLEVSGSMGHVRSLQVLLAALCQPQELRAPECSSEAQDIALQLVEHVHTKLDDSLQVCRTLVDAGFSGPCFHCLSQLQKRFRGSPDDLCATWIFGAQLLVMQVEEADGAGEDSEMAASRLSLLLETVEAAIHRPPQFVQELSSLLWHLGEALCRKGKPQAAVVWIQRALPFLSDLNRAGAGWRALAFCHQAAGENDRARRAAETALRHEPGDASTVSLLATLFLQREDDKAALGLLAGARVRRVDGEDMDIGEGQLCFLDLPQLIQIVDAALEKPSKTPQSCWSGLKLLEQAIEAEPDTAKDLGATQAWVQSALLETAKVLDMGVDTFADILGGALQKDSLSTSECRWFLHFALSHANVERDRNAWGACTKMLRCAENLLLLEQGFDNKPETSLCLLECAEAIATALVQQAIVERASSHTPAGEALFEEAWLKAERALVDLAQQMSLLSAEAVLLKRRLHEQQLRVVIATEKSMSTASLETLVAASIDSPLHARDLAHFAHKIGNSSMTVRLLEACLAKLPRPAHEQPQEILEFACAVQQQLIQLGKIEVLVRELREAISLFDGGSVTSTCLHKHAIWLGVEAWNTGARLIQAGSPGGDWLHQSRHLLQLLKKSDLAELAGAVDALLHRFAKQLC